MRVSILILALWTGAVAGCGQKASVVPQPAAGAVNEPAVQDFSAKLESYSQLREQVEKQLKPLPDQASAAVITARRNELSTGVQSARRGAREGDVFTPPVRTHFARIIATEMRGADGKAVREAAKQGNPKFENDGTSGPVKIAVNAKYPESAPASVMPPTLLLRLPKLPDEMRYRFVGPDLVLVDDRTGLVVDVFRRAAPGLAAAKQ
jgi:hypothetical protein